jgi:short-chain fatty acids transporter
MRTSAVPTNELPPSSEDRADRSFAQRLVALFVTFFERVMPDPFVLAVLLTFVTALLALGVAPRNSPATIAVSWYNGIFAILAFALQMILVLVTGHALASAPPVERLLQRLMAGARTPTRAMLLTFFISAAASWLNWGFGLVVGALVAKEAARRVRVDFAWLVAAAYTGFMIWASGPSSSIALAQAAPGNTLNVVEKLTGKLLPLSDTLFTGFNLIPTAIVVVLIPLVFMLLRPADRDVVAADPAKLAPMPHPPPAIGRQAIAQRLENAFWITATVFLCGLGYIIYMWAQGKFALEINSVIFIFLITGILLHGRPVAYAQAIGESAKVCGPLILQYPFYGGIMGIMTGTGLAEVMSQAFVYIASPHTLAFWSFLSSIIISLFVPSGGGHWAVQGPFVVPAATALHASQAGAAMGVAMGEQVANMLQPFWALPVVAIAGIGLQRVLGYTLVSFLIGLTVYGLALLFLVPV